MSEFPQYSNYRGYNQTSGTPYGEPTYGQTPYGQPTAYGQVAPYGAAGTQMTHPESMTALVLGIAGLFVGVTAPFAIWLGSRARREARENPERYRDDGMALTGVILGWVVTVPLVLCMLFLIALIFFGLMAA